MFDLDNINEIFAAIKQNRLRTFLTALGVVFGILILVILMGRGKGFENKVESDLGNFATNSSFFWTQKTTEPYKGLPKSREYAFNFRDIDAIKRNVKGVEFVAPWVHSWGVESDNNIIRGDKKGNFTIYGTSPDMNQINPVEVKKGRYINGNDLKNYSKVCLLGPRVVEVLFDKGEDPIGEIVKINGLPFMVVGVFQPLNRNLGNREDAVYTPYTTLQRLYKRGDNCHAFIITAKPGYSITTLEKDIFQVLARNHHISPTDEQAIGKFNIEEIFIKMTAFFMTIKVFMWIIGIGTLITGVIGVSNIMLVVVKERTKEIGIKRAIGARPRDIIKQVLTESVLITSFAGFWGFLLGVLVVELIARGVANSPNPGDSPILNPYVDFNVAVISLCTLIVLGSLAGLLPAKRAINYKPVDALRSE